MRRVLALFGLALYSDLRVANIHHESAADIAMIWLNAAMQLRDYATGLENLLLAVRESATSDTPKQ